MRRDLFVNRAARALFARIDWRTTGLFYFSRGLSRSIDENQTVLPGDGESKWKTRRKNGRGGILSRDEMRGKGWSSPFGAEPRLLRDGAINAEWSLFSVALPGESGPDPRPGNKFNRSGTTISSQTRQCRPRCFVTTGVRLSCHQSGQFTDGLEGSHCVEAPSRPSTVCAYAGTHSSPPSSLPLSLSISLYLPLSLSLSLSLSIYAARAMDS